MRIMHTYHLRRPVVNSARKIIPGFPRRFHRTWNVVSVPTVGRSCKFFTVFFVWVLLQLQSWSWVSYKLKRCTNLVKKVWKKWTVSHWVLSNFQYPSQAKLLFQRFCCLTCANITQGVVAPRKGNPNYKVDLMWKRLTTELVMWYEPNKNGPEHWLKLAKLLFPQCHELYEIIFYYVTTSWMIFKIPWITLRHLKISKGHISSLDSPVWLFHCKFLRFAGCMDCTCGVVP